MQLEPPNCPEKTAYHSPSADDILQETWRMGDSKASAFAEVVLDTKRNVYELQKLIWTADATAQCLLVKISDSKPLEITREVLQTLNAGVGDWISNVGTPTDHGLILAQLSVRFARERKAVEPAIEAVPSTAPPLGGPARGVGAPNSALDVEMRRNGLPGQEVLQTPQIPSPVWAGQPVQTRFWRSLRLPAFEKLAETQVRNTLLQQSVNSGGMLNWDKKDLKSPAIAWEEYKHRQHTPKWFLFRLPQLPLVPNNNLPSNYAIYRVWAENPIPEFERLRVT